MTPADKTALVERVREVANHPHTNKLIAKDLLALCDLAESPDNWLPIESAPRDGTVILLCRPSEQSDAGYYSSDPEKNYWKQTGWMMLGDDVLTDRPIKDGSKFCYTHWQPMPTGPKPTPAS